MSYLLLILFILLVIVFWLVNLVGAPGNWMIVAMATLWAYAGPTSFRFSWAVVIALILIAAVGEAIEFGASVFGTKKLGGSTRGATFSVIGSVIGGIAGAVLGIPIPIPLVGSLIGSVLFACTGALIGAVIGEKWEGKPMKETVQIGGAAFAGRLVGTLGKLVLGSAMVGLAVAAPFCF
jgi:uncharacterized protein YqgC (DUF456 family)